MRRRRILLLLIISWPLLLLWQGLRHAERSTLIVVLIVLERLIKLFTVGADMPH